MGVIFICSWCKREFKSKIRVESEIYTEGKGGEKENRNQKGMRKSEKGHAHENEYKKL